MTTGLQFYEASHRYKLDGEWVDSVTGVLSAAIPKPGIPQWAAKSVAQYVATHRGPVEELWAGPAASMVKVLKEKPWEERDAAGKRGTDVHKFAERIVQGEQVDVPVELAGHVRSAIFFLQDWQIKPVLVEARVAHRGHRYAGTLDLIADHNRGPRAAFDYKTSRSGIHMETAFQVAAYAFAEFYGTDGKEHAMAELRVARSYGVHLRADGYTVYPLRFDRQVFREFTLLLQAARVIKRAQGNYRIPGSGYVAEALPAQEVA